MSYTQPDFIQQIEQKVIEASVYDKSKSDEHGEVFTPASLINEMLDQLPPDSFTDSSKTFFDPCAGKGQFPIQIIKRLMEGLQDEIKDEMKRYKHIMKNQLFMSEFQDTSCDYIQELFSLNGKVEINLHRGDTLKMPSNYFDKDKKTVPTFFQF